MGWNVDSHISFLFYLRVYSMRKYGNLIKHHKRCWQGSQAWPTSQFDNNIICLHHLCPPRFLGYVLQCRRWQFQLIIGPALESVHSAVTTEKHRSFPSFPSGVSTKPCSSIFNLIPWNCHKNLVGGFKPSEILVNGKDYPISWKIINVWNNQPDGIAIKKQLKHVFSWYMELTSKSLQFF